MAPPTRYDSLGSHERKEASSGSSGMGSYFPPSLPGRLTILLPNIGPATIQMIPSTHKHRAGDVRDDKEDLHGIIAMFGSNSRCASDASYSIFQRQCDSLTSAGFIGGEGWYTGGFSADWDGLGGLDARVSALEMGEMKRKTVPQVMKLIARKEEIIGVLKRGVGDDARL